MRELAAIFICAGVLGVSCAPSSTFLQSGSPGSDKNRMQTEEFAVNEIPLTLPLAQPKIVVVKSKRRLILYSEGKLVRVYRVGLGLSPVEDKVKEGDRRTPEGAFYIFTKNDKSNYYLSLALSYPNAEDAERGLRDGLIDSEQYNQILAAIRKKRAPPQNTSLGGEIYIHGNGSRSDWTWGCVALDDQDIRELFNVAPVGTEVIIEH